MSARAEGLSENLNFIGGEFVPATSGKTLEKRDPSTGEPNAHIADSDLLDAVGAIRAAHQNLAAWTKTSAEERAALLTSIAAAIEANAAAFALAIARDLGTPVAQTLRFSVPDAAAHFRAHASLVTETADRTSSLKQSKAPVGLVAVITPASDPLACLASRVAPALAQGNAVIAKVARTAPETGVVFAQTLKDAGVPAGVFACLQGRGDVIGEILVQHPGISTIAFMGSSEVGRRVNAVAAESMKKIHLSLGAKNAVLLFGGVDLENVVPKVAAICAGLFPSRALQGSRLFVQQTIFGETLERLKAEFDALRIGSPLESGTQLGPLPTDIATKRFREAVAMARKENGKMVTGANAEQLKDHFVSPTLFADLTNCSTLQQDEIAGPLVLASSFKYQHEALKHANVSPFGRAGYVFEADPEKADRVARKFEVGCVYLNSSEPHFAARQAVPLLKNSGSNDEGTIALLDFFSRSSVFV